MDQNEQISEKILDVMQINGEEIRSIPASDGLRELLTSGMRNDLGTLFRNFIFWCKPEDLEALKVMDKKARAKHYVKHVVGELNGNVQRCVICGEIINDYRNAMWPVGQPAPTGFAPGDLYITNGNPKMYVSSIDEYDTSENCNS
jgi:hypothetical protein